MEYIDPEDMPQQITGSNNGNHNGYNTVEDTTGAAMLGLLCLALLVALLRAHRINRQLLQAQIARFEQ